MATGEQIALPNARADVQILDLRHFPAERLALLLEAENDTWARRLQWDYRASVTLLSQYLDARALPGFVALVENRIVGYAFCVYEDRKAVIGDVFAFEHNPEGVTAAGIESLLLEQLFALLQNSPGVERIESQLLLHTHEAHAQQFRDAGFLVYRRVFMDLALQPAGGVSFASLAARAEAGGYTLRPWLETDFNNAASLIALAYEGHLDSFINDQYRSMTGSLRFLHNIVRFPGCGIFDAAASHVLVNSAGTLSGLVLCSRVHEQVQHVTQLCVAPSARGMGFGELLLRAAGCVLAQRGFRTLSLTVTEGNTRAQALYSRLGFAGKHSFDAMVWTRPRPKDTRAPRGMRLVGTRG